MGGSSYSDAAYRSRIDSATRSGKSVFTHSTAISTGAIASGVHEKLDPSKKNSVGKLIRESFDSAAHPESLPIAVLFDVTGSMSTVPVTFVKELNNLMKLLVKKGYVKDPHVLFGAIGDATCDSSPLQVGQFESGNEMDEVLSLVHLEGGGGGQMTESYELGMYYMARHTDLHSVTNRGKKGYLFILGDEFPYPKVKKDEVKRIIGDTIQSDIPTDEILAELRQKFEVFWILPAGTGHFNDTRLNAELKRMFGQNLLKLDDAAEVCKLISSTVGLCEGHDLETIESDLVDLGASKKSITNALTAVKALATTRPMKNVAKKTKGKLATATADDVERL